MSYMINIDTGWLRGSIAYMVVGSMIMIIDTFLKRMVFDHIHIHSNK